MTRLALVLALLAIMAAPAPAQVAATDPVAALLTRLEAVLAAGVPERYLDLLSASADRPHSAEFASTNVTPGVTRAAVRERDRTDLAGTLPGQGYRLLVEVMIESGPRARVETWRLDVKRRGEDWGIEAQEALTSLAGLYRLSLNTTRQIAAKDLVVQAEDLKLSVPDATIFVAGTDAGPTALVVLGRGDMSFLPAPATERSQLRVATGQDALLGPFDGLYVRLNPAEFAEHVTAREMIDRPVVDVRDLKRADEIFRQDMTKSFGVDLADLSGDSWSLLPMGGDFLAEIRTRRYDTLTYARSMSDVEDITVFDRRNRHNLSVYASREHLARFSRFYADDQRADYAVRSQDLEVSYSPARRWLEGQSNMVIETLAPGLSTFTLKLAEPLSVRGVVSNEFGRLLSVRVRNQNSVVVNLPGTVVKGFRLHLVIAYAGRLEPQAIDREGIEVSGLAQDQDEEFEVPLEESFLFSNRSYWYPQAPWLGYAPADLRVNLEMPWGAAASGELLSVTPRPGPVDRVPQRQFSFSARQPIRYLALLVSRMAEIRHEVLPLPSLERTGQVVRQGGTFYDEVRLSVFANPRQKNRGRDIGRSAADILTFYSSLVGDFPYPAFSIAGVERRLPGGHSPAYLAVVAFPGPSSTLKWSDDPGALPGFPDFFIAHEIAHQWWGQAVGWKNYHEQWLSEGFAQYFSALYAERSRGRSSFDAIIRRMQGWAVGASDQGPIYLGYRIGHVKGDSRVFRAVVYNKGAMVLHMLRRLVGDQVFFAGLRRFYSDWRFKKAGTNDFRQAMEQESGRDLKRFFDQWVFGQDVPRVSVSWRVELRPDSHSSPDQGSANDVIVRLEQLAGVFDVAVTVSLEYVDGRTSSVVVKLTDQVSETRIPLAGELRKVEVNKDQAAVGIFTSRQ